MSAPMTTLILAGSRGPADPVARLAGVSHKAFAPIAGIPMLVRVVRALTASPAVGTIHIAIERPDLVRDHLAAHGFTSALVNIGEYAALGGPFRLGIADPVAGMLAESVLTQGALAVSSPQAMQIGGQGHILHPQGQPPRWSTVAVEADSAALADLAQVLEKRFARPLNLSVQLQPDLIGGIRVVVGDEVLDTSVKARLEQMKVALSA